MRQPGPPPEMRVYYFWRMIPRRRSRSYWRDDTAMAQPVYFCICWEGREVTDRYGLFWPPLVANFRPVTQGLDDIRAGGSLGGR